MSWYIDSKIESGSTVLGESKRLSNASEADELKSEKVSKDRDQN